MPAAATAPTRPTTPTTSPSGDDLDPIVSFVDFRGVTLEEAIDQLRDITGVNIVVEWRALEAAGLSRTARVEVRVTNLSLKQLLELTAELAGGRNLGMSVQTHRDVVVLTLEDAVAQRPVVRVYDVRDLVESHVALHAKRIATEVAAIRGTMAARGATLPASAPTTAQIEVESAQHEAYVDSIERLRQVIMEAVDVESWRENGGAVGSIREFNGRLIITQTAPVHDRIAKLLEDLRPK